MPLPPQQQIRQDTETSGMGINPNPFLGSPAYTSPPGDMSPKPLDSFSSFNFPNSPEPSSLYPNKVTTGTNGLDNTIGGKPSTASTPPKFNPPTTYHPEATGPLIAGMPTLSPPRPPRVLPVAPKNNPPITATNSNYQANIQSLKPRGPTTSYRGLTPARTQDQINFDMASYWASPAFQARMRQDPSQKARVEQYLASHPELQKDYNLYLQAGNMNRPIAKQANQIKISEEQILDKIKKDLKKLNNESQIKLSESYIDEVTSSIDNFNLALKKEAESIWDGMCTTFVKEGASEDFLMGFLKEGEEFLKFAQKEGSSEEFEVPKMEENPEPVSLPTPGGPGRAVPIPPHMQGKFDKNAENAAVLDFLKRMFPSSGKKTKLPPTASAPATASTASAPTAAPAAVPAPAPATTSTAVPAPAPAAVPAAKPDWENRAIDFAIETAKDVRRRNFPSSRERSAQTQPPPTAVASTPTAPPPPSPPPSSGAPEATPSAAADQDNFFGLGGGAGGGLGGFLLTYLMGQMMGLEGPAAFIIPMLGGLTGYNFFKPSIRTV